MIGTAEYAGTSTFDLCHKAGPPVAFHSMIRANNHLVQMEYSHQLEVQLCYILTRRSYIFDAQEALVLKKTLSVKLSH